MLVLGLRSERCQAQHWLKNVSACTAPVLIYRYSVPYFNQIGKCLEVLKGISEGRFLEAVRNPFLKHEYRLCIYLGHKTVKVRDLPVFIDQSLCIVYSELIPYHGLAHNLPIEAVLTLPFLRDQKFFK